MTDRVWGTIAALCVLLGAPACAPAAPGSAGSSDAPASPGGTGSAGGSGSAGGVVRPAPPDWVSGGPARPRNGVAELMLADLAAELSQHGDPELGRSPGFAERVRAQCAALAGSAAPSAAPGADLGADPGADLDRRAAREFSRPGRPLGVADGGRINADLRRYCDR